MCPIDAIEYSIYMPAMRVITAITQEEKALITTSFPHGYDDASLVRIYIPDGFGMPQINLQTGYIAILNAISFYITIDTRTYDAFIVPALYDQVAQVVPIGEFASTFENALNNVLPFTV